MRKTIFLVIILVLVMTATTACGSLPLDNTPVPPTATLTSAPPPVPPTQAPPVPPTLVPTFEPPATATSVSADPATMIFDQLYYWSNGAPHVGLPDYDGQSPLYLVHGDIMGESYPAGCYYAMLTSINEVKALYPGTYRLVVIVGGSYEDRVAVANDRLLNLGTPCTQTFTSSVVALTTAPVADRATMIYDQLFKWSNGAPHVGLPDYDGQSPLYLVHGDIMGESYPAGCYYAMLTSC